MRPLRAGLPAAHRDSGRAGWGGDGVRVALERRRELGNRCREVSRGYRPRPVARRALAYDGEISQSARSIRSLSGYGCCAVYLCQTTTPLLSFGATGGQQTQSIYPQSGAYYAARSSFLPCVSLALIPPQALKTGRCAFPFWSMKAADRSPRFCKSAANPRLCGIPDGR